DLARLPNDQTLIVSGTRAVYHATAPQIPNLLREIGRLRETSFRLVGEGTGNAIDLDEFDPYYHHLFIWDSKLQRVMGAYRMGATDEILPERGKNGLYTSTLFRYKTKLLKELSPALELGRSFVHPDHQRSYGTLLMLWRGVGHYCLKYPRYKNLFGPVSISNRYNSLS
ncbi:MAG: GNAT family N-acetyltransferase, partial [Planctomycetota bacterium]